MPLDLGSELKGLVGLQLLGHMMLLDRAVAAAYVRYCHGSDIRGSLYAFSPWHAIGVFEEP